jgi:hypothetical protein
MKRPITAALAATLLLAGCDGPLFFAEVEVPDLRANLPTQSFPAFDPGNPADWCDPTGTGFPPCVATTANYDLGAQVPSLTEPGVTYELRLTDVALTLSATQPGGSGASDLSGIVRATVIVGYDPNVPGSGTVVASYVRPPTPGTPATVAVSGNANLDLSPFVAAGFLPVRVEVEVDSGMPAFNADILAAFYIRVTLDWGSFL